jgi:hypothetical protein
MPVWLFVKALPTWVKVGAACGLLLGVMQTVNWWNNRDLKRDLAKQQQLLKETQEAAARTAVDLQRESDNRANLEAVNARQNAQIRDIATRARQAEAAAALATIRQIKDGEAAADALRQPTTTVPVGEKAMNVWLSERFK